MPFLHSHELNRRPRTVGKTLPAKTGPVYRETSFLRSLPPSLSGAPIYRGSSGTDPFTCSLERLRRISSPAAAVERVEGKSALIPLFPRFVVFPEAFEGFKNVWNQRELKGAKWGGRKEGGGENKVNKDSELKTSEVDGMPLKSFFKNDFSDFGRHTRRRSKERVSSTTDAKWTREPLNTLNIVPSEGPGLPPFSSDKQSNRNLQLSLQQQKRKGTSQHETLQVPQDAQAFLAKDFGKGGKFQNQNGNLERESRNLSLNGKPAAKDRPPKPRRNSYLNPTSSSLEKINFKPKPRVPPSSSFKVPSKSSKHSFKEAKKNPTPQEIDPTSHKSNDEASEADLSISEEHAKKLSFPEQRLTAGTSRNPDLKTTPGTPLENTTSAEKLRIYRRVPHSGINTNTRSGSVSKKSQESGGTKSFRRLPAGNVDAIATKSNPSPKNLSRKHQEKVRSTSKAKVTPSAPKVAKPFKENTAVPGRSYEERLDLLSENGLKQAHFRRLSTIGMGTFGKVELSEHETWGLCAVKKADLHITIDAIKRFMSLAVPERQRLRPAGGQEKRELDKLRNLLDEIEILSRLKHDNIVRYLGGFLTEEKNAQGHGRVSAGCTFHLVLSYADLGSAFDWIFIKPYLLRKKKKQRKSQKSSQATESSTENEKLLSETDKLSIALQILKSIGYLHSCDPPVVHRDIKSPNVVLSRRVPEDTLLESSDPFHAQLCDFGLARSLCGPAFEEEIPPEKNGGSVRFMAPELFRKPAKCSTMVDMWSFGCFLLELFGEKLPFFEASKNDQHVLHSLMEAGRAGRHQPPEIPEKVPKHIRQAIQKCHQKTPKHRVSAQELLSDLCSRREEAAIIDS